jgi:hypothetical protein
MIELVIGYIVLFKFPEKQKAAPVDAALVLYLCHIGRFSVAVLFRNKAQFAGNGPNPCQKL